MLPAISHPSRLSTLRRIAVAAVTLLLLKVLVTILIEYRRYFPADFDSAFLTGREKTFFGLYATAFYVHILTGPLTVVLAALLMWSGGKKPLRALHRWMGRVLMLLVLSALVPSGLIMSRQALAGPVAGWGLAALSLATGFSATATMFYARAKRFMPHQRWAIRCFILLISPLLLRLVSGGLSVMQWETPLAYCLNAWCSWLLPLVMHEAWWRVSSGRMVPSLLSA